MYNLPEVPHVNLHLWCNSVVSVVQFQVKGYINFPQTFLWEKLHTNTITQIEVIDEHLAMY